MRRANLPKPPLDAEIQELSQWRGMQPLVSEAVWSGFPVLLRSLPFTIRPSFRLIDQVGPDGEGMRPKGFK